MTYIFIKSIIILTLIFLAFLKKNKNKIDFNNTNELMYKIERLSSGFNFYETIN